MNYVAIILLVLFVVTLCVAVGLLCELREAARQRDYWRDVALDECGRADAAEVLLKSMVPSVPSDPSKPTDTHG